MQIKKANSLKGEISIPGDKSISHRAVMFGSIASDLTEISNFLPGADCLSTIDCFRKMGITIEQSDSVVLVHGKGLKGLSAPTETLDVGNSGTTTRLISGILVGQTFESTLSGDMSLNSRPMNRIIKPLSQMGAHIESLKKNHCAPLRITEGILHGIDYRSKVASAQIKSALLLAGLYADGPTSIIEPTLSRNHTELMLKSFGATITSQNATARILPCEKLYGQQILIPGDISSAAYFIAAAMIVPNSEVLLRNVGINPTRAGILKVCQDMGGDITLLNETTHGGEPTADLLVRSSSLHGITIEGSIIPSLIDEIPIIAILAAFASGKTIIRDAGELKVKETDRILTITANMLAIGADITPTSDGMIIKGGAALKGSSVDSYMDHRIAMAFAIAGLACEGTTTLNHSHCVDVSYPQFFQTLHALTVL